MSEPRHKGLFGVLVIAACSTLFAARPFTIDDAGTVASSGYEVEVGYDVWEGQGALGFSLKHGLTSRMDLGVGFGYNILSEPKHRFYGGELSMKYKFVPDFFSATFVTEFRAGAYILNGILTRGFRLFEANLNLGYCVEDSTVTYGCLLVFGPIERLNIGIEATGDKEGFGAWLIGANYSVFEILTLDCGFASDFDFEYKVLTFGVHSEF